MYASGRSRFWGDLACRSPAGAARSSVVSPEEETETMTVLLAINLRIEDQFDLWPPFTICKKDFVSVGENEV